jgi:UDP-4-amino-4,6-dideoxy-N-acetyl-beta-L-altrosamine N-acetyltransferase
MIDLREPRDDDVDQLFQWRREPEVDRWMGGLPPDSREGHRRWWEGFRADPDRTGWIITRLGRPAGLLTLTGLSGPHKRAQWGWYIGDPDARGRGAGRAAQALGLDRAFDGLRLEKVWSEVFADNDTALKAQAAAGFRREGYLRRHYLKNGVHREWREKRESVRRNLTTSQLIAA